MSTPAGAAASLARHLDVLASGLRAAADAVPHEVGFWSNPARVLLLDLLDGSVDRLVRSARACTTVAGALAVHAEDLTRAELLDRRAAAAPPGEAERLRAEAAELMRASGRRLLAVVEPATRELPGPQHGVDAVAAGVKGQAGSFLLGLLHSATAPVSVVRWVAEFPADPGGHLDEARRGLAAAAGTAVDPGEWWSAFDLDTLRDDPARWTGALLPALVGAVGAGSAARGVAAGQSARRQARAETRGRTRTDLARLLTGARSSESRRQLVVRAADATSGIDGWTGEGKRLDARQLLATDRMRDLSASQASRLTTAMEDLVASTGLALRGLETNVKGADSLRRKTADRFGRADRYPTVAEALASVHDIVRFTVEAPGATYVPDLRRATRLLEDRGFHLHEVGNAWADSGAYRGVNTTWTMPDTGVRFEVQFHTPESWHATVVTHGPYEEKRLLPEGSPEWRRLDAEIRAEYAKVPPPPGIDELPADGYRPAADPDRFDPPPDLRVPAAVGAGLGGAAATDSDADR